MNTGETKGFNEKNRMSTAEIVGLLLLSALLTACFHSVINSASDAMLPNISVTILRTDHAEDKRATILFEEYENNPDELFLALQRKNEDEGYGWEYVQGVVGESWTMLVGDINSDGISIEVKESPRKYLSLLCNRGGGVFEIRCGGETIIVDTYRDQDQSDILRIYPFVHSVKIIIIRGILYCFLFLTCMCFMAFFYELLVNRFSAPEWMKKNIGGIDCCACFILLSAVGICLYKFNGIPNYLEFGDEMGYWKTTIWGDKESVLDHLSRLFPLRGYLCYVPQSVFQYVGKALSIDPVILWILFLELLWTFLICVVFPGLYKNLNGNSAKRLHVLPLLLILLTTQRLYLTSVLFDGIAMIAFFAFLYHATSVLKAKNWITAGCLAGFFASVSCNLRVSYFIGIIGCTIYVLVFAFKERYDYKRIVEGTAMGILFFLIVCIPQFAINYNRGHEGMLPYDGEYSDDVNPDQPWYGRSLAVWSSDYGMAHGNIAYPLLATDNQMLSMKTRHYGTMDPELSMEQLLDIYSDSPVEAVMLIIKKLLIGFDQKTNVNSPGDGAVPWRETKGILFSLWNYFVLFSGCYFMLHDKEVRRIEKHIFAIIMLFLVLPQSFLKIEWRYILAGYFMIYYFFTYAFAGHLLEDKQARRCLPEKSNYLISLALFMFGCLTMSFIFLAEFN